MDFYYKIIAGLLIGLLIGAVNFILLRFFVRLALKCAGRVRAVFVVISGYLFRYLLIGAALYWLMKRGEQMVALIFLAVLGALTIILAVWQQKRKCKANGAGDGRY